MGIARGGALHVIAMGTVLAGMMLAAHSDMLALDPTLDITQYAHTAWKIRDGFSKGIITSIAQTPDGYLWLGTEFGLLRFDGVRNMPWQPPTDQHLPSSRILSLLADRDGALWIGTSKGLASWKSGKLTQYQALTGSYVASLLEDREGLLWAGTLGIPNGGLCSIQRGSVRCYGEDGGLGRGVFNLYEDRKGNLWAGGLTGLWRWKPDSPKFYPLPGEANGIQGLGEDNDGALLIGIRGGVRRFVDGKTETYPLSGNVPQFAAERLLRDRNGGLWIATADRGLVHVHQGRTDVFAQSDNLSGNAVFKLFEDREGNIWAASTDGLDRFRDFAVATLSEKQGLTNPRVGAVLSDRDGSVWLSTYGGLDRWNNGRITIYGKRRAHAAQRTTGSDRADGKLNGQNPTSLFQDDRGRIWVSTYREFGYLENNRFVSLKGVSGGAVHSIAEGTTGDLWIANQSLGLFHLRPGTEVEKIPWATLGRKDYALALAADPLQGGLWLGFAQGGVAYFKDGQVRASYAATDGLGEGSASHFRFGRDGALWVATEGGLSRMKNGRFATLTSKNGLPCDAVHWMMEDDAHSLWLKMACGLVRVALPELDTWAAAVDKGGVGKDGVDKDKDAKLKIQATVFDSSDGVRSHALAGGYSPHVAKSSDGKLWFLPWDGVSVVDPRHLPFNRLPPPVHIEQVTADRKTYEANSDGHLRLPPLLGDLEIDYTALSLVAPEKVLFRYKLEGWDRDWQDAGTRRQAFYSNLPPRNYRFRVVACNNSGVWNEAGSSLDFFVAPAYYQTIWFRLSCVAAFLALIVAVYQLRLRQMAQQFNMRLEERVNERIRIAQELHDTLLQGVLSASMQLNVANDQLADDAPAKALVVRVLELMGRVVEDGRNALQGLRPSRDRKHDLDQAFSRVPQELAFPGTADFRVIVEGTPCALRPVIRDEVYRIGREALANAFRHSDATKIEVVLEYAAHDLRILVRDNGCGINPQMLNSGREGHWGLSGMRERAERVGAELKVWSGANGGTEVGLSVPGRIAFEAQGPSNVPRWLSKMYARKTDSRETDSGKADSSKTDAKEPERKRRAG